LGLLIYFLYMFLLLIIYVLLIKPVHFFLLNAVLLELTLSGLQGIPLIVYVSITWLLVCSI